MRSKLAIEANPISTAAKGRPHCCPECGSTQFVMAGTPVSKNDVPKVFVPEYFRCIHCNGTWSVKELRECPDPDDPGARIPGATA